MNNQILTEDIQKFAETFELWKQLQGKTFLVTGATGLIGSILIRCLLELNRQKNLAIEVIAVVRDLEKAKMVFERDFRQIEFKQIALADISKDTIGTDVDYIIHLASPTASKYFVDHPVETLRTSIEGTTVVLDYARIAQIESMVFASSLEVHGTNVDDKSIDESFQGYVNPLDVRSSYNMGKRAAECLCHAFAKEYGVPAKIARLTQTTGAGITKDDNRIIAQFARLAAEGKDIILHTTGEAARPYCYTMDAISAILYILLRGESGEAYNVANEETYISAKDMAEYLKKNFNSNICVKVELNDSKGYAPTTKLKLNSRKIQTLGWKPTYGMKEIIERLTTSLKNG